MQDSNRSSQNDSKPYEMVPHARQSRIRFLLLLMLILVAFTNQYAFNNPQALEDSMEEVLDIDQSQFQLFYSLYALPNVFTLFFIGYLSDKFGVRISLVSLAGGITVCQFIIAIGGYIKSYALILTGRILLGIVSEALFIPQACMISLWFQGTQQAFALGIGITFPELGNAFNSFMSPLIYQYSNNLGDPLMFSFGLCVLGLIAACAAAYIDKRAELQDQQNNIQILDFQDPQSEQIKCQDIKKLRKEYWISAIICTAAMSMWIPFMDNVNRMFQKRFCYTQVSAGNVITIAYTFAVILSIPLGIVVDNYGKRRILSVIGIGVFLAAQIILLMYPQCVQYEETGVIVGLALQGIGYAFYATVLVASIPLVCRLSLLGTAFGFMQMLQSFFQFLIPILTGIIVQSSQTPDIGYRYSSVLFIFLGVIGLGASSCLFWNFKDHYKKKLDRSSAQNLLAFAKRRVSPQLVSSWSFTSEQFSRRESGLSQNQNKQQIVRSLLEIPNMKL